ncbi:arginase [Corynebacterium suranareeae]|uniref:Arginase n=1 Tax=Corynebacterium suranareeae TaxID=2506452 RepID=A0A160PQV5_9CORY|nr:arginase family protein [Corynebacterium suranareeae]BAU96409.1 arginase [Corynebacterium suranareeae]
MHPFSKVDNSRTLRLVWPQWQGAGRDNISVLLPEYSYSFARRGYETGAKILDAILPPHAGPTEVVSVPDVDDEGVMGGIESRSTVFESLGNALKALDKHDAERVLTLGGECSVSVAPFSQLAAKYGDDLAVIWIDSHPDSDTTETNYNGYHAMALSTLIGHGDQEITATLPATVDSSRVAIAGLHAWEEDAYVNVDKWGIRAFSPDDLRDSTQGLVDWLKSTGASKIAIHLDVDTVDSDEAALGLGKVPGGLTTAQVQ